ncbi:MAG TPA: hypothetical protein VNQ80_12315 [Parapedobacter sp.]|uniref:hypothetical protein n=1 Tax=Parapedobacter sp. TaxID=1958893 RepID=UPI002C5E3677|nr:hypothetical protein [Parapedobacter sp.]HWK58121.1 hypothetical protein [Parapedobacter sp.]
MEQRINIICSIKFTKLSDVIRYVDNHDGTATLETSQLTTIPMHAASGRMTVTGNRTNGVELFNTQITARIKEIIPIRCVGIVLVEVCNDATYIIGTDDLPVTIEPNYTTTQKAIQIVHQNTHIPLKTA